MRRWRSKTYFVECSDVKDPLIVFNPEFFPSSDEMRRYWCIALANDVAGFSSDKDVAVALKHMFTMALELPNLLGEAEYLAERIEEAKTLS